MAKSVAVQAATDWTLIKEDFIAQNLALTPTQKPFSLKQIATAHGISYQHVRAMAAKQKWLEELKRRREETKNAVAKVLQTTAAFNEIEVRTRQSTLAKLAADIGRRKLASLTDDDIKKLSVRDSIDLLRLGLQEERAALGLDAKKPEPPPDPPEGAQADMAMTPQQIVLVAQQIIDMRRTEDGSFEPSQ